MVEREMDNWNDDRLDELSRRMDAGFKETREGFARMDQKFERLLHTLVLIAWGFAGSTVAALAAVLVAALS